MFISQCILIMLINSDQAVRLSLARPSEATIFSNRFQPRGLPTDFLFHSREATTFTQAKRGRTNLFYHTILLWFLNVLMYAKVKND